MRVGKALKVIAVLAVVETVSACADFDPYAAPPHEYRPPSTTYYRYENGRRYENDRRYDHDYGADRDYREDRYYRENHYYYDDGKRHYYPAPPQYYRHDDYRRDDHRYNGHRYDDHRYDDHRYNDHRYNDHRNDNHGDDNNGYNHHRDDDHRNDDSHNHYQKPPHHGSQIQDNTGLGGRPSQTAPARPSRPTPPPAYAPAPPKKDDDTKKPDPRKDDKGSIKDAFRRSMH